MINDATTEAVEQARAFCKAAEADGWEFISDFCDGPERGKRLHKNGWAMLCVFRPPRDAKCKPYGMVAIYDPADQQALFEGTTYSAFASQHLANSEVEESDE